MGFASLSTSLLGQQQAQQEEQQAGRPLFSHVPLFELAQCVLHWYIPCSGPDVKLCTSVHHVPMLLHRTS